MRKGFFSEHSAALYGTTIYSTPDGGEVEVTQVAEQNPYPPTATDVVCVGDIVAPLRKGRQGSAVEYRIGNVHRDQASFAIKADLAEFHERISETKLTDDQIAYYRKYFKDNPDILADMRKALGKAEPSAGG